MIRFTILVVIGVIANTPQIGAQPVDTNQESLEVIDSRSENIVRSMGGFLGGLPQFSFVANVNYDRELETGQLVEAHEIHEVSVRRPGQLRATVLGENGLRAAIINKGTATLVDPLSRKYFQCAVPETLGEAIDVLVIDLGLSLPSADFIYADPDQLFLADVVRSEYLGVVMLDEQACHHMAFVQDGLEWQLWVSTGVHPLPKRISLRYIDRPGSPRFSASLQWRLSDVVYGETAFNFVVDDMMQSVDSISQFVPEKSGE